MQSLIKSIKVLLTEALQQALPIEAQAIVTPNNPKVKADFVSPIALQVFNQNKVEGTCFGHSNPRALAQHIVQFIPQNNLIHQIEVAGNGFINFSLYSEVLQTTLERVVKTGQIFLQSQNEVQRILVDFSSPNIAKEMHVGHLRSTIIGDSLCRIFEFQGHDVLRVNHLGDWGTQFGMLLSYLVETFPDWETNHPDISDLELFYKAAKKRFDEDDAFKELSRQRVVELQSNQPDATKIWEYIVKVSKDYLNVIYQRLDIVIEDYGESFYNPIIPSVLQELIDKGIAQEDEGALCLHLEGYNIPLIARKRDGGYGYDSTDLAAARYRMTEINVNRAVYVTDSGQASHFYMIFDAAKLAGWHRPPITRMDHAGFGVVLGEDGKKFKTRSGDSVKLLSLLDEAKSRALAQLQSRLGDQGQGQRTHVDETGFEETAEKIGIAAIKYFDLKQNRISTYKFSFDQMLDPRGNTAVYLLYAYARICSIISKAGEPAINQALEANIVLDVPHERALALTLCRLPDVLDTVSEELAPHKLCDLLYEISVKFSEFYNKCKVIESEQQDSRLLLCMATKLLMEKCFRLLGISPLERI